MQLEKGEMEGCFNTLPMIQKYNSLFEVHILSGISFAFSVFFVRWLQIIHHLRLRFVPRLSVQLHKYPWVLCAFSCEHQLFNRIRTWEAGKKILELIYPTVFHYSQPHSNASIREQTLGLYFMVNWLLRVILCTSPQIWGSDANHKLKHGALWVEF